MYSESFSAAVCGIDGCVVHVEVDISDGLPGLILVGYLSSEVKDITITKMIQNGVERMAKISLFLPNLRGVP